MSSNQSRPMIVTASLIYANGPIHLGHMLEYWQADIWSRFQKMRGHTCYYVCGSDAHGTPIMLAAEKQQQEPTAYVAAIHKQQQLDFKEALVDFDVFYTTESEEAREVIGELYPKMQAKGDISEREIEQAFDEEANLFLPDRYVKGECPCCGAKDQYGDNCEACGSTYSNTSLKNPYSVVSGKAPVLKKTLHYFFELEHYTKELKDWISDEKHLQTSVKNKLLEWFKEGLMAWDISRDAPYFGVKIPGTKDKYFYVWFDAPIGYISIFKHFCSQNKELDFDAFWKKDSQTELHHFIGKDVMYFHSLFWPALLMSTDVRTPTGVHVHGFLTIGGKKMSKSRGTFITLRDYLEKFSPEYLRYYFATKLSDQIEDVDLNSEDFVLRVNADLVGKFSNIASRCARFINRDFNHRLADQLHDPELWENMLQQHQIISEHYEKRQFSHAMRLIMEQADRINQYIDQHKPWQLAKSDASDPQIQAICSQGLQCFYLLALWLAPVLPTTTDQIAAFLKAPLDHWPDQPEPLLDHDIDHFKPLLTRLDLAKVQALFNTVPKQADEKS